VNVPVRALKRDEGGLPDLDPFAAAELLAVAEDVALVVDQRGVIQGVTVADPELAITASGEWVGRRWVDTVTDETRAKVEALLREVTDKGISRRRQVNHPSPAGSDIPVNYSAVRVGREGSIVAVGRDMRGISTLQQRLVEAQQAMERDYWRLRHVETRYRLLFQMASEAILVVDAATSKVVDANAAAGRAFGEPTERLIGRTFPYGIAAPHVRDVDDLLAAARASGRSGEAPVRLAKGGQSYVASASCFRQDASTLLLVRLAATTPASAAAEAQAQPVLLELLERAPDGFVVTDLEGKVRMANRAFLDIAQLATEDEARGEALGTWLGRPGADIPVFLTMLRKHGVVRLMLTSVRGAQGVTSEVEVSAVWVPEGEEACIGFLLRDVGRRLAHGPQGARDLTRAVEQLTSLVGRVSLRDLVRDTIDLVERHFIEAALELTDDNRTSAAEVLGVSRQSLYVKLRRHRLLAADDPPTRLTS